jgi:hypothetical protein
MKNKLTMYKQQKQPFLHLRASGLKMGRVTKPKTNNNLYSVPIVVLSICSVHWVFYHGPFQIGNTGGHIRIFKEAYFYMTANVLQ